MFRNDSDSILKITVQRKAEATWPVVAEWRRGSVLLPVRRQDALDLTPEQLNDLVSLGPSPLAYGTMLGQALFSGEVEDVFKEARSGSHRLRVLLHIEAPDLKHLHWERLCIPRPGRRWDYLALDQQLPFSLYLPSVTGRRFRAIGQRDLRALLLVASPKGLDEYDLQRFDVADTVKGVRQALGNIPCDVLARVEGAMGPPTLNALCRSFTTDDYSLLHVVAHGKATQEETVIYLEDEDGWANPVTGTVLVNRLDRLELPHFAFLATCESASPKAGLAGLAQQMVEVLGLPALVAMTEKVTLGTAEAVATGFYRQLWEHGEPDRALVEACASLVERHDVTVPALFSRLGEQPLFSDAEDRDLTEAEIEAGLDRLASLLPERAPVLTEVFQEQAEQLRSLLTTGRDHLRPPEQVQWEKAGAEVNALCVEVLERNFRWVALGRDLPAYNARCPFPGLMAFGASFLASGDEKEDDRAFFFGRERLVEKLAACLDPKSTEGKEFQLLPILGRSGCGKSSLVLAGMIPRLVEEEPGLHMVYLAPGDDPLAQLEAILSRSQAGSTILVVDQFEEFFTHSHDDDQRQDFVDRLLAEAQQQRVVLTMRADFFADCLAFPELAEVLKDKMVLIRPMEPAELRTAMEQQAAAVGLRFEADLVNTILDDVQNEPGAMPLLQHALLELWKRRHGPWLRAVEYREAIGGVQGAIARTANALYDDLEPDEQERMRDIFVRLTRPGEAPVQGEVRRDTRRRVALKHLGGEPDATRKLVKRLADARLVVTRANPVTGQTEVEVAHEALIRHWPKLRGWLDRDWEIYWQRFRIEQAAQEWQDHGQDESYLWDRGGRLEDAESLALREGFLNPLEKDFVKSCVRQRRMRERKERRLTAGLAVGLAVAVVLVVLAVFLWQDATTKGDALAAEVATRTVLQAEAEESARKALHLVALQLLDNAQKAWDGTGAWGREVSLLQTVESLRIHYTDEGAKWLAAGLLYMPDPVTQIEAEGLWRHTTFSPDGRLVAAADSSGRIRLWTLPDGEQVRTEPMTHEGNITTLAFTLDGRWLVSGSRDGTARLWDVATGKEQISARMEHGEEVSSVMPSPQGHWVATVGRKSINQPLYGGVLHLWETASGNEAWLEPPEHNGPVTLVDFSPDEQRLVVLHSCGNPNQRPCPSVIRVLDVATGHEVQRKEYKYPVSPQAVALSPNGQWVAAGGDDGIVQIWEAETGKDVVQMQHGAPVDAVAFHPGGEFVLSGDRRQGELRLWHTATGDLASTQNPPAYLWGMAFSPNGDWVVSSHTDKTTRLWRVKRLLSPSGQLLEMELFEDTRIEGYVQNIGRAGSIAFDPEGQWLALAPELGGQGILWEVQIWEPSSHWWMTRAWDSSFVYSVQAIAPSQDGNQVAYAGERGVELVDLDSARVEFGTEFELEDWWTLPAIALSPDGHWLAIGGGPNPDWSWHEALNTGRVWVWNTTDGPVPTQLAHEARVTALATSPDGRLLHSGTMTGTLQTWDVLRGVVVSRYELNDIVAAIAWPRVAVYDETEIRVWDAEDNEILFEAARVVDEKQLGNGMISTTYDRVDLVTLSVDGQYLAASFDDGTVQVWEVAGGESRLEIRPERQVTSLALSTGGEWLAVASSWRTGGNTDEAMVQVWGASTGQELARWSLDPDIVQAEVLALAFTPDGQRLLWGSKHGAGWWLWHPDTLIEAACQRLTRNLSREEWAKYLPGEDYRPTCPNRPFEKEAQDSP